ncbi:unnamed protein product [Spirodela intermedia]|uniref:Mandelate racemase/muconate lactonizing enzyme C-terminal domain-containing protein n=1 Tax=Spirodela intermedia TaxID=51605 RepID=A0A7I8JKM5_SPIIN|nr:unnamed protein product [Spirodela intermedia]CAA6670669.1 unnamed protein product [Spirodela intermedia]
MVSSVTAVSDLCNKSWYLSVHEQSSLIEMKDTNMVVHINGKFMENMAAEGHNFQMEQFQTRCHAYFRLSASVALATDVFEGHRRSSVSVSKCANINAVWASLLVEEFVRLGLTDQVVPLAISASAHQLTTCISCYDERSLAYHAVGYARGSLRPAVVITSSGTAVSNLLPAPLFLLGSFCFCHMFLEEPLSELFNVGIGYSFPTNLLLTADRPPELHDTGANQAINQVNHFGEFVKHSFSLPPPTDDIPARMVLTTIDSAVYIATHPAQGPVHINCPFREPLENYPREWTVKCLKGLDNWMSNHIPFSKYYNIQNFSVCGQINEVLRIVQDAERGILIIGALLLAKQLLWPVVTDILSGLRLRKLHGAFSDMDNLLFVDHLDHVLVSDSARIWWSQMLFYRYSKNCIIGSRITSKRISQWLAFHSPRSYILVDKHPYRHDHSHIVTHRIQSTVAEFAESLRNNYFPQKMSKWSRFLEMLNNTVAREISFQISAEYSLTEPHVAHGIAESLRDNAALFIGNSMAVRDTDMFARGWVGPSSSTLHQFLCDGLPLQGIRVAGNRGASGIDGLLSAAVGFAVGCNKRVLCMVGDVSFLHDTNGLAILNQRIQRRPMTILVINNHGGAIFSLLPLEETTDLDTLHKYFYTSHDISVKKLCEAHSVRHLHVQTKMELQLALSICQQSQRDSVIEVESTIKSNSTFHSILKWSAGQITNQALHVLSPVQDRVLDPVSLCKIEKMEYSMYRIQLALPLTSGPKNSEGNSLYKEGYILSLTLDDGSVGHGEVAPIGIHKENLEDVEEQLRFFVHVIEGSEINNLLPILRGSFSSCVRCGIEMAVLLALAKQRGSSFCDTVFGYADETDDVRMKRSGIQVCALVDCNGTPEEVSHVVSQMVAEGFTTIKLKVARRKDPLEDAAVVKEIRNRIGNWSYEEAVLFGSRVKHCSLQYIEEPVQFEEDIIKFCKETNLSVALDETIDNIKGDLLRRLEKFVHPGIVAVVIKPSVVGGFENAALIAQWAQQHEKMAVISSAFESSLSLASYVLFSYHLECQAAAISTARGNEPRSVTAHGLGTYRWLKEDLAAETISVSTHPNGNIMEASVEDAGRLLQRFKTDKRTIHRSYCGEQMKPYRWTLDDVNFSCSIKVQEVGIADNQVTVFLHGFLGAGDDWIPIMKALSASTRCISVDLPGHGESEIAWKVENGASSISVELVGDILHKLLSDATKKKVVLVGYSMGARIALYMATKYRDKQIEGTVLISGSPGIRDDAVRRTRLAQDDARARYLSSHGLECFLKTWYAGDLWSSLRDHPHFRKIVSNRQRQGDAQALAQALSGLSIGRQRPLWEELRTLQKPILLVFGEKDTNEKVHSETEDDLIINLLAQFIDRPLLAKLQCLKSTSS